MRSHTDGGNGLLHAKIVFVGWVHMYKKGQVDWKWLSIFKKEITFLSECLKIF